MVARRNKRSALRVPFVMQVRPTTEGQSTFIREDIYILLDGFSLLDQTNYSDETVKLIPEVLEKESEVSSTEIFLSAKYANNYACNYAFDVCSSDSWFLNVKPLPLGEVVLRSFTLQLYLLVCKVKLAKFFLDNCPVVQKLAG